MKRMKAMMGMGRFQLLVVLAGVVLAAGLVVGSGASFTAHTANASNTFTTGVLTMDNSKTGAAIMTIDKMVPGEFADGSVTIKNTGDVKGAFILQKVVISDDTKGLAANLQLLIKDGSETIYTGPLSDLAATELGTWDAQASHTYSFHVAMPDNAGDPMKSPVADDAFQGATTTALFDWTAVSVPNTTTSRNGIN